MKHTLDYIRKNKLLLLIIAPAFIFHMLIIVPSGSWYCYQYKCGLFFWGTNAHDGIWHLALAEVAFTKIPFISPIYSGAVLTGYNTLMDVVMHILKFTKIPPIITYFKLFPVVWFVFLTFLSIILARKIKDKPLFIYLFLFFVYFGSSFTYLFTLYHLHSIWGSSGLVAMQSGQDLTNMQFALSLIFLSIILIIIMKKKVDSWFKESLILGILAFSNIGLKFYAGVISLFIISCYYALTYLKQGLFKRQTITRFAIRFLVLVILGGLAIIVFYNPFASFKSGPVLIFAPFATMHSIIEERTLFYLKDMVNARYFLYAHGGFGPRLISIELFSTLLVIFFSMGLRLFGLLYFFIKVIRRKATTFDLIIFLTIVFGALIMIFFIQKGDGWWNTVQFYYFSLFLANIFTAEFFYELMIRNKQFILLILTLIILLTLPANIDILHDFIAFPAPSYLSASEIKALEFLKQQPSGVVYRQIFNVNIAGELYNPQPLYKQDSIYVPAFTSKQVYFGDEKQLEVTNVNFMDRKRRIMAQDCSVLKEVQYIYKPYKRKGLVENCVDEKLPYFRKIYDEDGIKIYKVLPH